MSGSSGNRPDGAGRAARATGLQAVDAALGELRSHFAGSDATDALQCGRYTVVSGIGRGAVADVFAAVRDGERSARWAVKLLRPGADGEETLRRFAREQDLLRAVTHPNVIPIVDAGMHESGCPWFAMPLVDGPPLTHAADDAGLGVEARIELAREAFAGVAALHANGIVHRDVKPGNALAEPHGNGLRVRIIDCGIARALGGHASQLTPRGVAHRLGTPAYMAPEQWECGIAACDARADVFALGIVLGELACGIVPRDGAWKSATSNTPRGRRRPGGACPPSVSFSRWLELEPDAASAAMRARGRRSPERFVEELRERVDHAVLAMTAEDPETRPRDAREAMSLLGL